MKNNIRLHISLLALLSVVPTLKATTAPADTTVIDRNVTVERDFKPTIQSAGKVDVRPEIYEEKTTSVQPSYSFYFNPLVDTDFNMTQLGYAETNFTHAKPLRGFLRGGIGHVATEADFMYRITERKDIIFDISASHLGQWGMKTMSNSRIGFDFSKLFTKTDLYFGASGKNIYFTRYGKYFQYDDLDNKMKGSFSGKYKDIDKDDKANQWEIYTKLGVRSLPGEEIAYKVQTGYEAFVMNEGYVEHIINSEAMFRWERNSHHVGVEAVVQNHFNQADLSNFEWRQINRTLGDTVACNYHAIKTEPYYEYAGNRFSIHAGVNLDFCTGKQKIFLPSPNVTFEAKLTKDWLALYGGAVGDWKTSSVREHFAIMRYVHAENEIATHRNRTYIPVDAFLGLKMRPHQDLLIDIYAHYILTKYDVFFIPEQEGAFFNVTGADHTCWRIGGKFYYHYQDIIGITLDGHYNIRHMNTSDNPFFDQDIYAMGLPKMHILDREAWGINFRVDGKVNRKLTLYSANYFSGSRYALAPIIPTPGAPAVKYAQVSDFTIARLKPLIDLNIGAEYNFNRWLSIYLQVNNYLGRKHDLYYRYQTMGANFLAGVSWTF